MELHTFELKLSMSIPMQGIDTAVGVQMIMIIIYRYCQWFLVGVVFRLSKSHT